MEEKDYVEIFEYFRASIEVAGYKIVKERPPWVGRKFRHQLGPEVEIVENSEDKDTFTLMHLEARVTCHTIDRYLFITMLEHGEYIPR